MSISTLNDDLNILQNLAIPGFEEDVDVIQKLDDEPNDVGGLTAAELKAKFDEAGNRIKTYLNETLIPSISETVAEAEKRAEAEAARVLAEEQRAAAEQERVAAEAEREQAEAERRAGEAARVSAEEERDAAETARKESEAARALAEQNRVDTDNGIVAQATKAAEDAETAKDNAEKAAETASSAAIHQPIVGDNQNWWTWNIAAGDYVDTGIYAAGHSPYIGNNGNWWIGAEDTGVAATGPQGPQGIQGIQGQAGLAGSDGQDGADGKSAYQYAVEGGYTGTEEAFAAKLAAESPTALPNPNALTFTGAVTGSYDGSAPFEVEIPSGGGGITVTNTASVGQTVKITAVDENGQPTEWEAVDMASASAVTPELLYSGTAENVTSFQQDIDFKGHRNLVIVVSGTKGDAAIEIEEGSLYMDGNRFVFSYYSRFLSATSESAPNGCVVYTICRIGSDRCRVDFSQFSDYSSPFWEYLQASSSTQSSAKTCYLKSAASTAYEKIGVSFSASVPAVAVEVYGF